MPHRSASPGITILSQRGGSPKQTYAFTDFSEVTIVDGSSLFRKHSFVEEHANVDTDGLVKELAQHETSTIADEDHLCTTQQNLAHGNFP